MLVAAAEVTRICQDSARDCAVVPTGVIEREVEGPLGSMLSFSSWQVRPKEEQTVAECSGAEGAADLIAILVATGTGTES